MVETRFSQKSLYNGFPARKLMHYAFLVTLKCPIEAGVGADGLEQSPFPHTRSFRTASRGNPDLIVTFLVVDACDMNSVNIRTFVVN